MRKKAIREKVVAQFDLDNHNSASSFIQVSPIMKTFPRKALLFGAISIAVVALIGCAEAPVMEAAAVDPAATMLKDSIARSSSETPEFTASVQSTPSPVVMSGPSISLSFAGDAKTLLPKIAAANTMRFLVLGPQPHLPLFISVNVSSVPLEVLLRDIAEQFGQRASLALKDGAIEIRYRGVSTK